MGTMVGAMDKINHNVRSDKVGGDVNISSLYNVTEMEKAIKIAQIQKRAQKY